MTDPILQDLKQVSDEMLYARLVMLRQRFPEAEPVEDYVYRCDIWEMANKAVRAEIGRRKAEPPPWWSVAQREPEPPRQRYLGLIVAYVIAAVAAVVLFGAPALSIALMASVLVCGIAWLIPEFKKNQRI